MKKSYTENMIVKFIVRILINAVALWITAYVIPGVFFEGGIVPLLIAALIFTALNILLKPLFKLFFGPLIILTLGIFSLIINAGILLILDIISDPLRIEGYLPLLGATLLIGIVNVVLNVGRKIGRPH